MDHNAPHPNAAFEGYYSKFALPSGAHLAIVISSVRKAKTRPNALSITYVPKGGSNIFQNETFPNEADMRRIAVRDHAFIIEVPGIGFIKWNNDSTVEYDLKTEDFSFQAKTVTRTPWSTDDEISSPEGLLVNLPLPLHWHVHSLASNCSFDLDLPNYNLPSEDKCGKGIVHQEKNWAHAFPSAHMWVQAREGERGLCCAGGKILGVEAFLLGYRSNDVNLDFRPPFAVRLPGFSPFMSYETNWKDRSFELSIQNLGSKISIQATAPEGSFFSLSPPFKEEHRENFLGQSFNASIDVKIYESGWLGPWRLVRQDHFDRASLEFGGAYYPPAGSEKRFN